MSPLSTEPKTFGKKGSITDWEKKRQESLLKKVQERKIISLLSYRKELRKHLKAMRPRYRKEHPWIKVIPSNRNEGFRDWVRNQPEYRKFRENLASLGVKIPGMKKKVKQ